LFKEFFHDIPYKNINNFAVSQLAN